MLLEQRIKLRNVLFICFHFVFGSMSNVVGTFTSPSSYHGKCYHDGTNVRLKRAMLRRLGNYRCTSMPA